MSDEEITHKERRSLVNKTYRTKILNSEKSEDFKKKNIEDCRKWREQNKERVEAYREKNREKVLAYNKTKIPCICGADVSRGCMSRHRESNKHRLFLLSESRKAEKNDN